MVISISRRAGLSLSIMATLVVWSPFAKADCPRCGESDFVLIGYGPALRLVRGRKAQANALLFRVSGPDEEQRCHGSGVPIAVVKGLDEDVWVSPGATDPVDAPMTEEFASALGCDGRVAEARAATLRWTVAQRTTRTWLPGSASDLALEGLRAWPLLPRPVGTREMPPPEASPPRPDPTEGRPPRASDVAESGDWNIVGSGIFAACVLIVVIGLLVWLGRRIDLMREELCAALKRIADALEEQRGRKGPVSEGCVPAASLCIHGGSAAVVTTGATREPNTTLNPWGALAGSGPAAQPHGLDPGRGWRGAEAGAATPKSPCKDDWVAVQNDWPRKLWAAEPCDKAINAFMDGKIDEAIRNKWTTVVFRELARIDYYCERYLDYLCSRTDPQASKDRSQRDVAWLRNVAQTVRLAAEASGVQLDIPKLGEPFDAARYIKRHPDRDGDKTVRRLNQNTDNNVIIDIDEIGWHRGDARSDRGLKRPVVVVWSKQWAGMPGEKGG